MPTTPPPADATPERERALALLRQHGWNATSFQILEPGFRYWFDGGDACVAYLTPATPGWRPARPSPRLPARARRRSASPPPRPTSAAAPVSSAPRTASSTASRSRRCGSASSRSGIPADWDRDPSAAPAACGSRSAARAPRRCGLGFRRPPAGRSARAPRASVERLVARWQAARPMPPMGFLVAAAPAHRPRRAAVLRATARDGELIGFLSMVPVFARRRMVRGGSHPRAPRRPTAPPSCWSTPRCAPPPTKGAAT